MAVDGNNGNVYLARAESASNGGIAFAYSSGGGLLWSRQFSPWPNTGGANGVAVGNGATYVAGYSFGAGNGSDCTTLAYSGAGIPLWTNLYNGPGSTNDAGQAVAVGNSGNVYVAGYSYAADGLSEYVTLAYSSSGVALWTNRFGEPGGSQALALAVDGNDNVYVTGQSAGDCVTIKYTLAPAITLSATSPSPGPGCRLTIAAPTNITFRLEASTNLINWLTLTNFTNPPFTSMQYTESGGCQIHPPVLPRGMDALTLEVVGFQSLRLFNREWTLMNANDF